jgi:hypothetical protein
MNAFASELFEIYHSMKGGFARVHIFQAAREKINGNKGKFALNGTRRQDRINMQLRRVLQFQGVVGGRKN